MAISRIDVFRNMTVLGSLAPFLSGSLVTPVAAASEEPVPVAVPSPSAAHAGAHAGSLSLGLLAGLTYGNRVGAGSSRALLGLGGHAGYRFAATPMYLGFTVSHRGDDTPESPNDAEQRIMLDLDLGAELSGGWLTVRPYVGLGTALFIYEGPDGGSGFVSFLAPGVFVHRPLGVADVGVNVRWEVMPSHWGDSLAVLGSVGLAL